MGKKRSLVGATLFDGRKVVVRLKGQSHVTPNAPPSNGASAAHASQAGKGLSSNAEGAPAKGVASYFVKLPSPGATPKTMGKRDRPAEISDEEGVVVISD